MLGWECPGCARMWAPHVEQCRLCAVEQTQPDMPAFGPTLAELWGQYREWGEVNIASWRAVKVTAWRCHLAPALGDLPWQEVTPARIDAYVRRRLAEKVTGRARITAPGTVQNEIVALKACFSWSVKRKLIRENPIAGYESLSVEDTRDFFIPEADFLSLLRHMSPIGRTLLVLGWETGMRRDEMRLLQPHEIDWKRQVIALPARRVKGKKKGREIPLSELAAQVLRDAVDRFEAEARMRPEIEMRFVFFGRHHSRPIGRTAVWSWLAKARRAAGVKGPRGQAVWWHSLRKSFASIMAGEGHARSIYVLMDLLGHTSKKSHDLYTKITPSHRDALREAITSRRNASDVTSASEILRLVRAADDDNA